ncbi:MAG: type II toxin-antitoxin system VapC family toxin [Candidatus Zhuqueibacterota bacterium]
MEARRILIDTSVLIEYFRKQNKSKSYLWELMNESAKFFISSITEFEFYCGCKGQKRKDEARKLLDLFDKIDFNSMHSLKAGQVFVELRSKNQLINLMDILLAGVAIHEKMSIATLDRAHFSKIESLDVLSSSK